MVELAQLTGDRQADLKDERRRAQMGAARHVLERSTMMLLTSAKVNTKHSLHFVHISYFLFPFCLVRCTDIHYTSVKYS